MRRVVFITVMFAFAFAATPVMADPFGHGDGYDGGTAYWDRNGGYYAGRGGEFTIWGSGLELSNSAYADTTSGLAWVINNNSKGGSESFQSFCIEMAERIYKPMEIWVSEEWAGPEPANNGSGSHAWEGGTGSGDDLDDKTAYLYTQFATGQLNYAYNGDIIVGGVNLNRSQTAGALQRLIWSIEGEGGDNFNNEWQSIMLIDAQVSLISSWQNAFTDSGWTGIGNVRVLQTYQLIEGGSFELKQDQLYLTPAPGAVLLGMLGLGVAGLKLRRFT